MIKTFNELWEICEDFFKKNHQNEKVNDLINELDLKFKLYKNIDLNLSLSDKEKQNIKSRTLGEILLTITNISLIDNINVFESLNSALQYRSIETFSKKY